MVVVATLSEQESEADVELVDLSVVEQPEIEVDPIEEPIEIDKLFSKTEPVQSDILDQTIAVQRLIDPMSEFAVPLGFKCPDASASSGFRLRWRSWQPLEHCDDRRVG